jgi:pilus assembly protein CpaE
MAATETRLLQLRKDDFDQLLAKNVEMMRALLHVVSQRRAATQQRAIEESAGASRPQGLVTVVFSPRGGAGTTTIATNLAVALAQKAPDRVVLADLNVLFGHAAVLLNVVPRTSLASISANALRQLDRESVEFYLTPHPETALRVLTGSMRPEEGELVTGEHVRLALELLRQHFVHVVVDIGRSFSEVNLTAMEVADQILLVCTPEQLAVQAVRECQRIFGRALRVNPSRLGYVLNHPLPYKTLSRAQVEEILGVTLTVEIPFGGDVPTRAGLEGHPLLARWPGNATSKALVELAGLLDQRAHESLALAG